MAESPVRLRPPEWPTLKLLPENISTFEEVFSCADAKKVEKINAKTSKDDFIS
jgi:hypothetical protein